MRPPRPAPSCTCLARWTARRACRAPHGPLPAWRRWPPSLGPGEATTAVWEWEHWPCEVLLCKCKPNAQWSSQGACHVAQPAQPAQISRPSRNTQAPGHCAPLCSHPQHEPCAVLKWCADVRHCLPNLHARCCLQGHLLGLPRVQPAPSHGLTGTAVWFCHAGVVNTARGDLPSDAPIETQAGECLFVDSGWSRALKLRLF